MNFCSNCVNLLDLSGLSGAFEDVRIMINASSGGGGLKFAGAITCLDIFGNKFRTDGAGHAPSKPIKGAFPGTSRHQGPSPSPQYPIKRRADASLSSRLSGRTKKRMTSESAFIAAK